MRAYRVESETVRLEASGDAEAIMLEVSRTNIAGSRDYRHDPPFINSSYARAMRTRPGRCSSSSHAAAVAAGHGSAEAATAGIQRHRVTLFD
jgi:hypothetical protein